MKMSQIKVNQLKSMPRQKGVTLIELVVGAVMVALALAALVGVINALRGSSKADAEVDRLNLGFEKALGYLATSQDTSAISNDIVIRNGGVAADAISLPATIKTKFGGTTVYASASLNSPADAVSATQTNLDEKNCLNYVKAQGASFARTTVNGQVVKDVTDTVVKDAALSAACTNTAAGNTVEFVRLKS